MTQRAFLGLTISMLALLVLVGCVAPPLQSGAPMPPNSGVDNAEPVVEEITVFVGPTTVECEGAGPQTCLLVRVDESDEYGLFYDQIEGFEYEPGFDYELRVAIESVPNPPADGSSLRYSLVEIVDMQPAEVPEEITDGRDLNAIFWEATSYVDADGNEQAVLPDAKVTASFQGGKINGQAGCNSYFGEYEVDGTQVTGGQIATTMMACPEPIMEQEQAFLAALGQAAEFDVEGGDLFLLDANGDVVVTFIPLRETPLVDTLWQLTFYNNGRDAVVSVSGDSEITAIFGADGTLSGSAGCNNYSAIYEADDAGMLSIGPAAVTSMMCAEPEGVMEQEAAYLTVLSEATHYIIFDDTLELTDPTGAVLALYQAVSTDETGAVESTPDTASVAPATVDAMGQHGFAPFNSFSGS